MKEHKSHMSMVARFAYIFATIVTIFAQMGAAAPAMIADADSSLTVDTAGLTYQEIGEPRATENPDVFTHTIGITGPTKPADQSTFKVTVLDSGDSMNLIDSATNQLNDADMTSTGHTLLGDLVGFVGKIFGGSGGDNRQTIVSGWIVTRDGSTLTIKRNDAYKGPGVSESSTLTNVHAVTNWPMFLVFNASNSGSNGIQIDGSDTPVVLNENNTLNLSVADNGPTSYKVGDQVNLQVSDQNMIDGGEVDIAKDDVSQYLKFNYDKTVTLLENKGYTQSSATAADISQLSTDANSASQISKFTDGKNTFYLLNVNGDGHIVWPASDAKSQRTAIVAMDAVGATNDVSLQSAYLNGFLRNKGDYLSNTLDLKIVPSEVDATKLHMVTKYVVPAISGSSTAAKLTGFPYFYMKDTDSAGNALLSTVYNATALGKAIPYSSLETLRQEITAGTLYSKMNSALKSSTAAGDANFENFHQVNADGTIKAGTEKKLSPDKTYTLIPDNPLTKGSNRFPRVSDNGIASKNYYMPDGVPTFKVDSNGNISLVDHGDGNAIKNQWTASGNAITASVYHLKQVQVVDQYGDPVPAKLTLKNATTAGGPYMQADTSFKGTSGVSGELLPSDFDKDKNGPFYYADGAQAFDSLTIDKSVASQYDTSGISFSSLTINPTTDQLELSKDAKGATTANSTFDTYSTKNQVLKLTVHKYTDADSKVAIKKVAQSDPTKTLSGAQFHLEEAASDGATVPFNADTTTSDTSGMATATIDKTSTTATRVFHVTEIATPSGYDVGNDKGYYATWEKDKGFTGVGDSADAATNQASSDGLAKINDDHQLQIADPTSYTQGGGDSKMRIKYIDKDGNPIVGAQLPVLQENFTYPGTGLEGFSGLGGVIYNPDHNAADFMKPDSGITSGALLNDGSMAMSAEKSDANGIGNIQGLWSQTGVVHGWEKLSNTSNGWLLRNAIVNGGIPKTSPMITYQLITNAQKQRATGTPASGYYALGSTLVITGDGTKVTVENPNSTNKATKVNGDYRDNPVGETSEPNTATVQLYRVKHVQVVDTAGNKLPNVNVDFSGMTATTGSDGSAGDLTPKDGTFIFPSATQKLSSVTSGGSTLVGADGAALDNSNGFGFYIDTGKDDVLSSDAGKDAKISDDGQTVIITVQSPTTIKIHKQSKTNAATSVEGAKFNVYAGTDSSKAVLSQGTDKDGNTSVTLPNPDPNNTYHITEASVPSGYTKDNNTYEFTWTAANQVESTTDKTNTVSANKGTLNFADMPDGSGGVGDNGSNGGDLTIKKIDAADSSATPADGAQFTIKEITDGATGDLTSGKDITTTDGQAKLNLGAPTLATRLFTIKEKTAPTDYVKNPNTYTLKIDPNGTMSLGQGTDASQITNTSSTADGVIKFSTGSHTLNFADNKRQITIHKQDFADAATSIKGATFTIAPADDPTATATGTTDSSGNVTIALNKVDSNNKYIVKETSAPSPYVAVAQFTVALDNDGQLVSTTDRNSTSIDKNILTVKDVKTASGGVGDNGTNGGVLSLKKIAFGDTNMKALSGAAFTVTEPGIETKTYEMTDKNGILTVDLGNPTATTRSFTIQEKTAPTVDGTTYQVNSGKYRLQIDPSGHMAVGLPTDTAMTLTDQTTSDQVLKIGGDTPHMLVFGDKTANQPITITKLGTNNVKLSGATFQIFNSDATGHITSTNEQYKKTTDTDGLAQFTPQRTGNGPFYYTVRETQAPAGYTAGKDVLIVYQNGKITGLKDPTDTTVNKTVGPMTQTGDQSVTYTDTANPSYFNYPIHIRRQDANSGTLSKVDQAFKVYFQNPDDPSKQFEVNLNKDGDDQGNGWVSTDDIAGLFPELTSTPNTAKTVTVKVIVDPSQTNYTVPVPRNMQFTFGAKGGFSYTNPKDNDGDGANNVDNDGMITRSVSKADDTPNNSKDPSLDGANDQDNMQTGGLRLNLRRDTLVPESNIHDANDKLVLIPNATFKLAYSYNGQALGSQTVKTDEAGVAVIQPPTPSDDFTGTMPTNKTVNVTMTQVDVPDKYIPFTSTVPLFYNSAIGYTAVDKNTMQFSSNEFSAMGLSDPDLDAQFTPGTGKPDSSVVVGVAGTSEKLGVTAGYYFFGGSQIVVKMDPDFTTTLTDAPQVLNFGKAKVSTQDQTLNLIPSGDLNDQAFFDTTGDLDAMHDGLATDDKDAQGNATNQLFASVTQTAEHKGGWRLKMGMSALTSKDGLNPVDGSYVSMGTPTVTFTKSSPKDADASGMGLDASHVDMSNTANEQSVVNAGTDQSYPGTYDITWNSDAVKMFIPGLQGKSNTNYHSTISWDVVAAP